VSFVQAERADLDGVAACIAEAFQPLAITTWLVPDRSERMRILRDTFLIHVAHALSVGQVWTTQNHSAAAVWFPLSAGPPPEAADYERQLVAACGPYLERFRILDRVFHRNHPRGPHHHLAFLAVRPRRQRGGLGSALLAEHHYRLDRDGVPAYLEATSIDARRLYQRHGYVDHGPPVDLPDGPRFWPMWRDPGRSVGCRTLAAAPT
jgi:GNAT superfamily N-acetyltransferase